METPVSQHPGIYLVGSVDFERGLLEETRLNCNKINIAISEIRSGNIGSYDKLIGMTVEDRVREISMYYDFDYLDTLTIARYI